MAEAEFNQPRADRPQMPAGYGIATDPPRGGEPSWRQVTAWLAAARNYWVSSTRPDGRPHAMPVWGLWLDGALYFSTDRLSRKGRNLAARPEIVVHLESGDQAVILEGAVAEVRDAALLTRYEDAYEAKYAIRPDTSAPGNANYVVRPRAVLSWLESDFTQSATRWHLPAE